jgi:ADP-ribosylglycohydrolase
MDELIMGTSKVSATFARKHKASLYLVEEQDHREFYLLVEDIAPQDKKDPSYNSLRECAQIIVPEEQLIRDFNFYQNERCRLVYKDAIRKFIEKTFKYVFQPLDEIRDAYVFNSRTSYTAPPALEAFFESSSYETAIRKAISIGGDSDTIACMTGGIAEAYYHEIPDHIKRFCDLKIDITIKNVVREFEAKYGK